MSDQKTNEKDLLELRLKLQRAIADLGQYALSGAKIQDIFNLTIDQLTNILDVEYAKILEFTPDKKKLLLRAGVGWNEDIIVGKSTVGIGKNSQAGYTLQSNKPVIVKDLTTEKRFNGPPLLVKHKVISGMSVIIHKNNKQPFGVLGIHTKKHRDFTQDDIDYLQSVANILSLAIQREELQEDLMESQAAFSALYEANLLGVIRLDIKGEVIRTNDAFLEMIGYSYKDVEQNNVPWAELTPPEYKKVDAKKGEEFMKTGVLTPYEKEIYAKDGSRVPVMAGGAMLNKETTESIIFVVDLSDVKKAEQRKDEFMGIASHELKTPLTSIKGYIQLLNRMESLKKDVKAKQYINKTEVYIQRLESLIADLLSVSRIRSGKLELNKRKININEIINNAIEGLQPTTTKHKIIFEDNGDGVVYADPERLEQVMTNLLSNAIKYSPNSDKIKIDINTDGKEKIISVQDFGVGIPKRSRTKIFKRFYRVHKTANEFSGMGIGLYVASEIIKRHKGKMWVESEEGEGSTFYFSLPVK